MAIVTLDEVKEQLNLTGTDHDAELESYVEAITDVVEDYKGMAVELRERTETHDVGDGGLQVRWTPVDTLTSVERVDGTLSWNVADLHVDPDSGHVHVVAGQPITGLVQVVYTAGMDPVPDRYIRGALVIIQHNWETQRGSAGVPRGVIPSGVIGPEEITPRFNYAIPRKALEWLGSPLAGV